MAELSHNILQQTLRHVKEFSDTKMQVSTVIAEYNIQVMRKKSRSFHIFLVCLGAIICIHVLLGLLSLLAKITYISSVEGNRPRLYYANPPLSVEQTAFSFMTLHQTSMGDLRTIFLDPTDMQHFSLMENDKEIMTVDIQKADREIKELTLHMTNDRTQSDVFTYESQAGQVTFVQDSSGRWSSSKLLDAQLSDFSRMILIGIYDHDEITSEKPVQLPPGNQIVSITIMTNTYNIPVPAQSFFGITYHPQWFTLVTPKGNVRFGSLFIER